jgi:hypothetical protein
VPSYTARLEERIYGESLFYAWDLYVPSNFFPLCRSMLIRVTYLL